VNCRLGQYANNLGVRVSPFLFQTFNQCKSARNCGWLLKDAIARGKEKLPLMVADINLELVVRRIVNRFHCANLLSLPFFLQTSYCTH
jgi:hypothetical protein